MPKVPVGGDEGGKLVGGLTVAPDDSWRFDITDFRTVVDVLGPRVVEAFSCCLVHSDRLLSLVDFAALSDREHRSARDVQHSRNLTTMFWFLVGTLVELQTSIRALRHALTAQGLSSKRLEGWPVLERLETWKNPLLRRIRNKVSFHVDNRAVRKGLRDLVGESVVTVARGDSRKLGHLESPLGNDALLRGLRVDNDEFTEFIKEAQALHFELASAIHQAFMSMLQSRGLDFGEGRPIRSGSDSVKA